MSKTVNKKEITKKHIYISFKFLYTVIGGSMLQLLEKRKVNNLDSYYQEFLESSLFIDSFSFSENQLDLTTILKGLDNQDILVLKEELKNILEDILYPSKIHGKYHSEKVLFWAYIVSKDNHLDEVDRRILLDAAKYHDIGRTNDKDDCVHGLTSASKVLAYLDDFIYEEEENRNLLCAIIELHSLDDSKSSSIFQKYSLKNKDRFDILWKLLKDIDALDRIRYDLGYLDELSFNPKYLRTATSVFYIKASYELCTYYKVKYKV